LAIPKPPRLKKTQTAKWRRLVEADWGKKKLTRRAEGGEKEEKIGRTNLDTNVGSGFGAGKGWSTYQHKPSFSNSNESFS
jgi:hypothetical protein